MRHSGEPIEQRGVVLVDGGGTAAAKTALELARLGCDVALFRDSDVALKAVECADLGAQNVVVLELPDACATEERVFRDISQAAIQSLLDSAYETRGFESVRDSIRGALGTKAELKPEFGSWNVPEKTRLEVRLAVAKVAVSQGWFKRVNSGEELGAVVAKEIGGGLRAPLTTLLESVEAWAYG
jgi:hypothetical protein